MAVLPNSINERAMWLVDPLLGGDRDIGDCTAAVVRQRPANNKGMVFSAQSTKQQLNRNIGTVFSVWCFSRCYKQDNLGS
jgi:hypothetical protein